MVKNTLTSALRRVAFLAPFVWFGGCASRTNEVDRAMCERLRDHLIDLRLADAQRLPTISSPPAISIPANYREAAPHGRPMPTTQQPAPVVNQPIDVDQHRFAMQQAMGESFIGACTTKMSAAQVQCTLDANDSAAASQCSKRAPSAPIPQQTASK